MDCIKLYNLPIAKMIVCVPSLWETWREITLQGQIPKYTFQGN